MVAHLLNEAGHDAVHVRDYALQAAEGPVILERAGSDFGVLLAAS